MSSLAADIRFQLIGVPIRRLPLLLTTAGKQFSGRLPPMHPSYDNLPRTARYLHPHPLTERGRLDNCRRQANGQNITQFLTATWVMFQFLEYS